MNPAACADSGDLGVHWKSARELVGETDWPAFERWINGQTMAMCPGCHQGLIYEHDLAAFLAGERRVFD